MRRRSGFRIRLADSESGSDGQVPVWATTGSDHVIAALVWNGGARSLAVSAMKQA